MFTMKENYRDAVEKAQVVIEKLGTDIAVVDTAKVVSIVEKETGYRIDLYSADFSIVDMDQYGAFVDIVPDSNGTGKIAEIFINSLTTIQQQRFSLVHELGHLILGDVSNGARVHNNKDISLLDDSEVGIDESSIEEQRANIFALLVLMPRITFQQKIRTKGTLELSNQFMVTEEAVFNRLKVYLSTGMAV